MRRCMGCMREYAQTFDTCPHCGYVCNTPPKNKNQLPPGTVLSNRYTLGKVLGQGGFGITYIAWDARLEKPVAIKEFFPTAFAARLTGQNEVSCFNAESQKSFESGLQKMLNESRVLARFTDQTNIVQVLDCFEENATAYIVMELLRGETVQGILNRERELPLERTMEIMMPILQALESIHRTGLIHRDISPDNIFVCEDGTVKLLDFGAARIASGMDHKTLSVMLKKGFAPIEQYSSHGMQGTFTDVYAVCATMYKMLTGVTPDSSLDRMAKDTLHPISAYAQIPPAVEDVILDGMAVEAADRIQTVEELRGALQKALLRGQRAAAPERAAEKPAREPKKKQPKKRRPLSSRAVKTICIVLGALILAASVAIGGVMLYQHLRSNPPRDVHKGVDASVKIGDTVQFGAYGIENKPAKPIVWKVLDRSADQVLLVSEKGLDYQTCHGDSGKSFTWETAWIREWLNTDFYNAAFSEQEKDQIVFRENVTPDEPYSGTIGGNKTRDRCFLLSKQEAEKYFPTQEQRRAQCTDAVYNREFKGSDLPDRAVWWMLRSPGVNLFAACGNRTFLSITPEGTFDTNIDGLQYAVIRPAIWVDDNENAAHAQEEWVSGYREHLYDFSWDLQDGELRLSGNGVMPELGTDEWDDEFRRSVRSVVIEDGFTTIADAAFMDCVNLTSVKIPDGVQEIGSFAFRNCPNLKTISLPRSVRQIGASAFYQSGVAENQDYWNNGMMCLGHCLIRASLALTGDVKVPDSITVIGESAFEECKITGVVIPAGVTRLDHVFLNCENLKTATLPDGIRWIDSAFDYCASLADIRLPEQLQYLAGGFYACESLRQITLPQSVRYIGDQAFCCCWNLETATMYAGIEHIGANVFFNTALETVHFYGTEADWNSIEIEADNEHLQQAAFTWETAEKSPFAGLTVGDTVRFGAFEQDGDADNGEEAIEWIVAQSADDGSLLLLTRSVLAWMPYHAKEADVTWKDSSLRKWLNGTFYAEHFTAEEKERILQKKQDNPDNTTYKTNGGEQTDDGVFLLSLPQAQALDAKMRIVKPTADAILSGAFKKEDTGSTWWLLRSPGSENKLCAIVRSDGEIRAGGENVRTAGGVRPAIWIDAN